MQLAFCTFGGMLVLLYAFLAHGTSAWQEDRLLLRQMELELQSYLDNHPEVLSGIDPPAVASRFFTVHVGEDSLPPGIRQHAAQLPPGLHAIDKNFLVGEEFMLAVREAEQLDERIYMVYDVRRFEDYEWWHSELLAFTLAGGAVVAIGLFWAWRYSLSLLRPLTQLADEVAGEPDPVRLAESLAQRQDPVEVAHLSGAIERSMRTIDAFVQRERNFTRNASHELRTPLAVIRSAVELMRYESLSPAAARRLGRIERSVQQMEELIETFLSLARSQTEPEAEPLEIAPIVHRIVESHRHLLAERDVAVTVDIEPDLRLVAHPQIIAVTIANLVKNAFYSTNEGSVTITASNDELTVADTGPGYRQESEKPALEHQVHGFGLTIVRELCEHAGWRLRLAEREPHGTTATIDLSQKMSRKSSVA
ncbi:MAG: HAMP domain-containing histidine kinase [Thermoanaerobaculia bacterium]|nr:HAMP domain-containing histidine kinase [Thermoanaerobaculia bacterium]